MDKTVTGVETGALAAGATTAAVVAGTTESAATDSVDDARRLVVCVTEGGGVDAASVAAAEPSATTEEALTEAADLTPLLRASVFVCVADDSAEPFELDLGCAVTESVADGDVPAVVLALGTDAEASPAAGGDVTPAPLAPLACS